MMLRSSASQVRAFTLIEMMVVLVISGIMLTLVGPIAFDRLKAYQAKEQLFEVRLLLRDMSSQAYTTGFPVSAEFNAHQMVIETADGKTEREFDLLRFPLQKIRMNRNGFSDTKVLNYIDFRDRTNELNLTEIMKFGDRYIHVE